MSGETEASVSGWTTDTLHQHFQQQLDAAILSVNTQHADLRSMLDERYATQVKAIDAAFAAQQAAMTTALTAADRAVLTALLSAEKAVSKAEVAAEKRFDSVNEFRQAYQDIIAAQLPRAEAEARFSSIVEKITDLRSHQAAAVAHSAGLSDGWKILVAVVGLFAGVAAVVSVIAVVSRGG